MHQLYLVPAQFAIGERVAHGNLAVIFNLV